MGFVSFPCPKSPPKTIAQTLVEAGWEVADKDKEPDLYRRQQSELIPVLKGPIFVCGTMKPPAQCRCSHDAEIACDAPVGDGKTCDLPLCQCCATLIGPDYHLCPVHMATFVPTRQLVQQPNTGLRIVRDA